MTPSRTTSRTRIGRRLRYSNFDDHRDPFDRLLVAQSVSELLILLTVDGKLAPYGNTVRVI